MKKASTLHKKMNDRYGDVVKSKAELANAEYDAYLRKEQEAISSTQDPDLQRMQSKQPLVDTCPTDSKDNLDLSPGLGERQAADVNDGQNSP